MSTKEFPVQSSEGLPIFDIEQPSVANEGVRVTRRSKSEGCLVLARSFHHHYTRHDKSLSLPLPENGSNLCTPCTDWQTCQEELVP
jgi:hypothetical protein